MSAFPYGTCECSSGIRALGCCGGEGPAAYAVVRRGREVKLCTRCDLSSDRNTRKLLVTREDSIEPFMAHDALGAVLLAAELEGAP